MDAVEHLFKEGILNQWNIDAGTKVVMRVVFEQMSEFSATYTCHLCGTSNNLVSFGELKECLIDGSADWKISNLSPAPSFMVECD